MTTEPIGTSFLRALLATPAGRQHMLSVSVDAEEGDETGIFDQLAEVVTDPDLRRVVITHRDDEVRHAALYRECLRRNGFTKQVLPESVSIIGQVRNRSDEPAAGIHRPEDIVRTYALLLAIEERGVEQFPLIASAFEPHDPETAETYRRVTRDERGHVRYCQRVGRHHAASDEAWAAAVAEARAIEAAAFEQVGVAQAVYCAEQGWVDLDQLAAAALDSSTAAAG